MEKEKLSKSFVIGAVALLFLAVGYQTALFLHSAAVEKVAANRDSPDTVFVYAGEETAGEMYDTGVQARSGGQAGKGKVGHGKAAGGKSGRECSGRQGRGTSGQGDKSGNNGQITVTKRKDADHSEKVQQMREKLPVRKVESFAFNPNTVSVDDLCRLGFSPKQAQSIDNYRKKGGKFRRKEDFSKSYVVEDSVYKRLESYISIPKVDLNMADSLQLVSLPGIGSWFASKIITHRTVLGGFSFKEQLMDIYRFDEEKYRGLEDLVTVNPEYTTPYPLWSLPADSLAKHPYINYAEAKSIVFFREHNSKADCTMGNLIKAGILSEEHARKLSLCLIEPR